MLAVSTCISRGIYMERGVGQVPEHWVCRCGVRELLWIDIRWFGGRALYI